MICCDPMVTACRRSLAQCGKTAASKHERRIERLQPYRGNPPWLPLEL